jgi:hypothetical protein
MREVERPRSILTLTIDTAPERQSGRKAQISNIIAAKVCKPVSARTNRTLKRYLDCRRCNPDVLRPKGNAEDDSRPDGWDLVRNVS